MKNKKHPFLKIWLKVAVPVTLVSAIAMALVLTLTLTAMNFLNISRIERIALEDALILQRNPDLLLGGSLEKVLNMDGFAMVAIICDSDGRELARSDISKYAGVRPTREQLTYMMVKLETMLSDRSQNTAETVGMEIDQWGYNYTYGYREIHSAEGEYLLIYGGASASWPWYKNRFLVMGVLIMALVLLLSTLIAVTFYRMYCKEVRLEEYYVRTSNAIAHDLKTPLMAVSGYAENLLVNVHTEKREYYAQAILNNVGRMNGILESMLQLTNANSIKDSLHKQEVNLLELTEDVLAQYKDMLEKKAIQTSVEGTAAVTADLVLMRRVIDNLVNNAVKYTPNGKSISIRMSDGEYEIENTGVSYDGQTGIGLAIVHDILDAHEFRLQIKEDNNRVIVRFSF